MWQNSLGWQSEKEKDIEMEIYENVPRGNGGVRTENGQTMQLMLKNYSVLKIIHNRTSKQ